MGDVRLGRPRGGNLETTMRLALGMTVRTGWAACVVAGGTVQQPHLTAREHVELLGDPERFVFHRASEGRASDAARVVASARKVALERAVRVVRRLKEAHDVRACAIVAKVGKMPDLAVVLASHPAIHRAEGMFYRDVVLEAARACGLKARLVPPSALDARTAAVASAGRLVGKPWSAEWKLASLAAWGELG